MMNWVGVPWLKFCKELIWALVAASCVAPKENVPLKFWVEALELEVARSLPPRRRKWVPLLIEV